MSFIDFFGNKVRARDVVYSNGNSIATKNLKIDGTSKNTSFLSDKAYTFSGYGLDNTHTVEVTITDKVGNSTSYTVEIGIGKVPFQVPPNKNCMGIGRYCDEEGQLQVGYDLRLYGKILDSSGNQMLIVGLKDTYDF